MASWTPTVHNANSAQPQQRAAALTFTGTCAIGADHSGVVDLNIPRAVVFTPLQSARLAEPEPLERDGRSFFNGTLTPSGPARSGEWSTGAKTQ